MAALLVGTVPLVMLNFATKFKNAELVAGVVHVVPLKFPGVLQLSVEYIVILST